jgi:hypothetical protein
VQVRVGVSHDPEAEGNCVVARRGGEQLEANWQSAEPALAKAGDECAREGVQTAWWKSVPGQAMTPKLKVTASSRGGVESNRKRTGSPQDNELDSAGWYDEPAHSWRSPEIVQYAGNGGQSDAEVHHVVGGGMLGSLYEISGETCRRSDGGRSQRPNSTDAAGKRARGVGSKTILREVGQEERGSAGGFKRPTNGK